MSFNIPSFPDLPALPALPTLPSVLPPGLPSGSFADMVNAAATQVGMQDAVQQAQAQIDSVKQLQGMGIPMPPNVMNLAHSALESVTNFSPSSMFMNPAEEQLNGLSDITGAITSSLTSALSMVPSDAVPGIKDIAESVSSVTRFPAQAKAEICSRISSLGTDVPILLTARNLQNQAKVVNAAATGAMTSDVQATLLDNSFPSGAAPCSGLNLDDVFKPVTQAASHFGAGLSSAMSGVTSTLGPIVGEIKDAAGNVLSGTKALAQQITSMIGSAITSIIAAAAAQVSFGGLIDGLKSQLSSITSAFGPMIDGFKSMVTDAKNMLKQAINLVKSFSLINLLTHTDPCVKGVMAVVTKTDKVDPIVVSEIAKPKSERTDSPVQTGIERAKVNAPIPEIPVQTTPNPVPPLAIPNPYTKAELAALKQMIDPITDEIEQMRKQAAAKDAEIAEWRKSVNYDNKLAAANIDPHLTRRDPGFGIGRSPDPAVNAAWKEVLDEHRAKRAEHEAMRAAIDEKLKHQNSMYDEYEIRSRYGKTPYTTMATLNLPAYEQRPQWAWFVFLDSGV